MPPAISFQCSFEISPPIRDGILTQNPANARRAASQLRSAAHQPDERDAKRHRYYARDPQRVSRRLHAHAPPFASSDRERAHRAPPPEPRPARSPWRSRSLRRCGSRRRGRSRRLGSRRRLRRRGAAGRFRRPPLRLQRPPAPLVAGGGAAGVALRRAPRTRPGRSARTPSRARAPAWCRCRRASS